MTEFHDVACNIAGFEVLLRLRNVYTAYQCKGYLSKSALPPHIELCATDDEIEKELPFCDGNIGAAESICVQRKFCAALPKLSAFMLHASVIEVDGEGYGFFGLSGAGKSTHTRLWKELLSHRACIVNGDKPVIRFDGKTPIAYGTPWCGKENWNKNTSVPLKALCKIVKSKENRIREMSKQEAVCALMGQVIIPEDAESAALTLELLDKLIGNVKIYELACDVSLDAARLSFETMKGERI